MLRMDKIIFFALILPLYLGAALASAPATLDHKYGVIFPLSDVHSLLHTCSRDAPGRDGSENIPVWDPGPSQIADLEKLLPAALFDALSARRADIREQKFIRDNMSKYIRQYGGIEVSGAKLIYVNAIPPFFSNVEKNSWRTRAVQVCDGGVAFFGTEYDPATKKFIDFQF